MGTQFVGRNVRAGPISRQKFLRIGGMGLAGAALLGSVGCSSSGSQQGSQAEYTLTLADHFPTDHLFAVEGSQYFMDRVTELTNGRVDFEFFPAEQLGSATDLLSLTQSGTADIGDISAEYNDEALGLATVGSLPGVVTSSCAATEAIDELVRENGILYEEVFAREDIRPLSALLIPPYDILTNTEVTEPSDLQGLRLRSPGGAINNTINELGASPAQLAAPEVYTALERGTIDGVVSPRVSIEAYSYYEVTDYALTGFSFGSLMQTYSINNQTWSEVPQDIQEALNQAGQETSQNLCSALDKQNSDLRAKFENEGLQITEIPSEEQERWRELLRPVQEEWAQNLNARGEPGSEVLRTFSEEVESVNENGS